MNISTREKLVGVIKTRSTLTGAIDTSALLTGQVNVCGVVKMELDWYEGSYEVKPTSDQQILPTKQKTLSDNLIIKPIPYVESANSAGGTTVTIG